MAFATRITRIANPRNRVKRSYRRKRVNASAPVKRKRRTRVKVYRTKSEEIHAEKAQCITGDPHTEGAGKATGYTTQSHLPPSPCETKQPDSFGIRGTQPLQGAFN